MPGVELAFNGLLAVAIVALLAILRRERRPERVRPVWVGVVVGVVLGISAAFGLSALVAILLSSIG